MYAFAMTLHLLSAVIWVGGMFFAYVALRPVAASLLEPPLRLSLWARSFARFFPWVWVAVALLLGSGLWIILGVYGGMGKVGWYIHAMLSLGLLMSALFAYVYFLPYPALRRAVTAADWPTGAKHLATIRRIIGINLGLGLLTVVVACARYW